MITNIYLFPRNHKNIFGLTLWIFPAIFPKRDVIRKPEITSFYSLTSTTTKERHKMLRNKNKTKIEKNHLLKDNQKQFPDLKRRRKKENGPFIFHSSGMSLNKNDRTSTGYVHHSFPGVGGSFST